MPLHCILLETSDKANQVSGDSAEKQNNSQEDVTHRPRKLHDLQVGLVAQIVDLRPEERDAPANLHEAEPDSVVAVRLSRPVDEQYLFRLVEVRDVALGVGASPQVSGASAEARAPGD